MFCRSHRWTESDLMAISCPQRLPVLRVDLPVSESHQQAERQGCQGKDTPRSPPRSPPAATFHARTRGLKGEAANCRHTRRMRKPTRPVILAQCKAISVLKGEYCCWFNVRIFLKMLPASPPSSLGGLTLLMKHIR